MYMCAQGKNERQRKERMAEQTTETRGEGSVKSIRATLVKVRTLVRHEHKAIRIQQRFSTFVPSIQAESLKFEQGRLAAILTPITNPSIVEKRKCIWR
jgi:hypothetical protein